MKEINNLRKLSIDDLNKEKELVKNGISMVIYANHLLRSSYKTMKSVAETILLNERALEAEKYCLPVKETLELIK